MERSTAAVTNGKCNILLVDDRPENLLALEAVLEPLNQNLVTATSGEEALRHLLSRNFAAILLDVQMPEMDGFETAMRIRERPRTQDIPIIFITAISQEPHHALRGYSTGAVDYIFKPFDPWALRTKVSVLIELHHLRGADARLEELTRSVEGSLTELVGSLDQLSAQELGPAAADAITLARGVVERLRALTRQVDAIQTRGDPERPSDRA